VSVESDEWIRRYRPAPGAAIRLVCLPHAGGSASFFLPVAAALSPDVDVLAVQYPGRQDRRHDPMIDDLGDLADAVVTALKPWLDRPFAFFGHSMGATLAFEVTRRLEQGAGPAPLHLFASGRRAPSRHRDENVHLGGDDRLIAELTELSGTDTRVLGEEEMLRLVLPAIRNDYRATETYRYRPGPPLSCPITVLTGDADPKTSLDEAEAWREQTTGSFDLRVYPGGHFYLADHQSEVLGAITDRLMVGLPGRTGGSGGIS
jgi:surfactin synthase thioesterase subunit